MDTRVTKAISMVRRTGYILCLIFGFSVASTSFSSAQVKTKPFESWILACLETEDARTCELDQNVADPKGQPVLQIQLGPIEKPELSRIGIRFPVDVSANQPIVWSAGDVALRMMLVACQGTSCFAEAPVGAEVLDRLGKMDPNALSRFTMRRANGAEVVIPLSLTGFSDALTASASQ
jgi:invasion protein IalB